MTSIRHSQADDAILDAALASILAVGIRHTTLTEVARRAGVSRMTAYRRFSDANTLLRTLMTREFGRVLEGVLAATPSAGTAADRLVWLMVEAVRAISTNPLMRKVVELDMDLLHPYFVDHLGSTQIAAETVIRSLVEQAQADGSMPPGDPAATAMLLLLTAQSLVLSRTILENTGQAETVLTAWESFLRATFGVLR